MSTHTAATADKLLQDTSDSISQVALLGRALIGIIEASVMTTVQKPEAISNRDDEAIIALRGDDVLFW